MVTITPGLGAVRTARAESDNAIAGTKLSNSVSVSNNPPVSDTSSVVPSGETISISTLSGRLSRAADVSADRNEGLSHKALGGKVLNNQIAILYPLDSAHKAAYAKQAPEPSDSAAVKSAAAATAYIGGSGPSPFAGLSREQLSTIQNDESGTFTVNEKRAAYRQAYIEEEAWRGAVLAQGSKEYTDTGKLTNFFKSNLAHFLELPKLEQALYPENYASDLGEKIKLDFNYLTHSAGNSSPSAVSLANSLQPSTSAEAYDIGDLLKIPGLGQDPSISS